MSKVIARRYAKALIDLAAGEGIVDRIEANLGRTVRTILEDRKLRNFFFNPVYKTEDKQKLLSMVTREMEISGLLKRFLELLLRKDRFPQIEAIYKEYVAFSDELNSRAEAEVTSALPLADGDKDRLKSKLEQITGKTIYLKLGVDPSLLGGAITRIGSVVYDGSVRSQLARLREQIIKG